ncbi:uncharacterized protein BKA55DRAFT_549792, partial [Fusarium redolens]
MIWLFLSLVIVACRRCNRDPFQCIRLLSFLTCCLAFQLLAGLERHLCFSLLFSCATFYVSVKTLLQYWKH